MSPEAWLPVALILSHGLSLEADVPKKGPGRATHKNLEILFFTKLIALPPVPALFEHCIHVCLLESDHDVKLCWVV